MINRSPLRLIHQNTVRPRTVFQFWQHLKMCDVTCRGPSSDRCSRVKICSNMPSVRRASSWTERVFPGLLWKILTYLKWKADSSSFFPTVSKREQTSASRFNICRAGNRRSEGYSGSCCHNQKNGCTRWRVWILSVALWDNTWFLCWRHPWTIDKKSWCCCNVTADFWYFL